MMKIPVARPLLGEEEANAARAAILSGWVTQGPKVKEFEDQFARYTGAKYAAAVSNCTTALHLALKTAGVSAGDVVITASYSFIATANSIRACGAEPVFVDIGEDRLNLDAGAVEHFIEEEFRKQEDGYYFEHVGELASPSESQLRGRSGKTGRLAAILVVHQAGMPANLARFVEISRKYNVPLIEDAACAIGSEVRLSPNSEWERIGRPHGDLACFSFHPRKLLTTGDGGMITMNRPDFDKRIRALRQHGMTVSDLERHNSNMVIFENYGETGYNFRLTDIQAAVGSAQLARMESIVAERRALAEKYKKGLSGLSALALNKEPAFARTNWQSYVVYVSRTPWQLPLMQRLLDRGISTRRAIMCSHLEAPYQCSWYEGRLMRSEIARDSGIVLPMYPGMTDAEIGYVIDSIRAELRALA